MGLELAFTFNHRLPEGSVVVLRVPDFTAPNSLAANVTLSGDMVEMFDAAWDTNTSLGFTVRKPIPGGTLVSVQVDASNGIMLPKAGLPYRTDILSLSVRNYESVATNPEPMSTAPMVGLIRSTLSFTNPTADSASGLDFELGFSMGKDKSPVLLAGDEIYVKLPGFAHDGSVFGLESADNQSWVGNFGVPTWDNATGILTLPVEAEIDATKPLAFGVTAESGLRLPTMGTSGNTDHFTISLLQASLGDRATAFIPMQVVDRVGALTNSTITMDPMMADEVTEITLKLRFTAEILQGEHVAINADFTVEDVPMALVSQAGYRTLALGGEDSDKVVAEWGHGLPAVRLRALEDIEADFPLDLVILKSNGLKFPGYGYTGATAPITVSAELNDGIILPTVLEVVSYVGAFHNASVTFGSQICSEHATVKLDFTPSMDLLVGDEIVLRLPNFHVPDTGAALPLAMTSGYAGYMEAYARGNETVVYKVVKAGMYANVEMYATLKISNYIRLPGSAVFLDSKEITIEANCTNGKVPRTPVALDKAIGLSTASVQYANPAAGERSKISLTFTSTNALIENDGVFFKLPGFKRDHHDFPDQVAVSGPFNGSFTNVSWTQHTGLLELLTMTTIPANTEITLVLGYGEGFELPYHGTQLNDPSLQIKLKGSLASVPWTSIEYSPSVGAIKNTALEFTAVDGSAHSVEQGIRAGKACGLKLMFNFSVPLVPTDMITVTLPSFSGPTIGVNGHGGELKMTALTPEPHLANHSANFTGRWDGHTGTLTLIAQARLDAFSYEVLTISAANGIVMSPYGNRRDDPRLQISTNATAGAIAPIPITHSTAVGAFTYSEVKFAPKQIQRDVEVSVVFKMPSALSVGDTVSLVLPGMKQEGPKALGKELVKDLKLLGKHRQAFNGTWENATSTLVLTVGRGNTIPGETLITLEVSRENGLQLPRTGIVANDHRFTIEANATTGPASAVTIMSVPSFGIQSSALDFSPIMPGEATRITLGLDLTCDLRPSDEITLVLPHLTGTDNNELELESDDGILGFAPAFRGSWVESSTTLTLNATHAVTAGYRHVFIKEANGLKLPTHGVRNGTAFTVRLNSNCTGGEMEPVPVGHYPVLGTVDSSSLSFVKHHAASPTAITVAFNLSHDIKAGDIVTVELPGFNASSKALSLGGKDGTKFAGTWSQGEYAKPLNLKGNEVVLESNARILGSSMEPSLDAQLEPVPAASVDVGGAIVDRYAPPFVKRISSVASAELEPLGAGDVVVLEVEFNHDVVVEGEPTLQLDVGVVPAVVSYDTSMPTLAPTVPAWDDTDCTFERGLHTPACNFTTDLATDLEWTIGSGSTPTSYTGPSSAYAGSYYAYVESTNNAASKFSMVRGFEGARLAELSFAYHMYSYFDTVSGMEMGTLNISGSDDGASWYPIWEADGNQGNSWKTASITLGGTYNYIRFLGTTAPTTQNGGGGDIAIDNIKFSTQEFMPSVVSRLSNIPLSSNRAHLGGPRPNPTVLTHPTRCRR